MHTVINGGVAVFTLKLILSTYLTLMNPKEGSSAVVCKIFLKFPYMHLIPWSAASFQSIRGFSLLKCISQEKGTN